MTVDVRDPLGFVHGLKHDGRQWHGHDNLAHAFDERVRNVVTRQVLDCIENGIAPPHGFRIEAVHGSRGDA